MEGKEEADGFIYGATWAMIYQIIYLGSGQWERSLENPSEWQQRGIAIASYIFIIISGYALRHLMNEVLGFSVDKKVTDGIFAASLLLVFERSIRRKDILYHFGKIKW